MADPRPFKHRLGADAVTLLAAGIRTGTPGFPSEAFVAAVTPGLAPLELKDRVNHVATVLRAHLPASWPEAVAALLAGLPPALSGTEEVSGGFLLWPVLTCVELYGLDHPGISLAALREMTRRFSAEFAVRPYLERHPDLTLSTLAGWVEDADPHVRRLVSEGTRPRLPWGRRLAALQADPSIALAFLDRLVDDPELYVRRSVANHLGDIAKDHPDVAVRTAQRWMTAPTPQREWVVRHGLRAMVKAGHPGALGILGFHPATVGVDAVTVRPARVAIGGTFTLSATLRQTGSVPQRVVVDYAIVYARPSGRGARKVFKGAVLSLEPGGWVTWSTRHVLRDVSIRTHHPGVHMIELMVQGEVVGRAPVDVVGG